MIDLEVPKKFRPLVEQARGMAEEVFWPISRKYDRAEHEYPAELDLVSAVIDGMSDSGAGQGAGAIHDVLPTAELVARLRQEFAQATEEFAIKAGAR